MLIICDADGMIRAVSSGADGDSGRKHFTELFGVGSDITRWLIERVDEARSSSSSQAEKSFEHEGKKLSVTLESLRNGDAFYGVAIQVNKEIRGEQRQQISEGDAVVTRQQWHDIKNHLGGLKLYATFLNRKLPPSEERQTVERMLNGLNVLIEHLAKIRRGESQ
ncbi:MAG TPA: hypothetical protein VLD57_12065 [Blastocatellia bacterium]|nr:hypothetical protein [Blastocatellia bacterium]